MADQPVQHAEYVYDHSQDHVPDSPECWDKCGDLNIKAKGDETPRCDHICLLDDGHVERGEAHLHGYELPSPRSDARAVELWRVLKITREHIANGTVDSRLVDMIDGALWPAVDGGGA